MSRDRQVAPRAFSTPRYTPRSTSSSDARLAAALAAGAIPDRHPTESPAEPAPAEEPDPWAGIDEWFERTANPEGPWDQPDPDGPPTAPADYAEELLARTPACLREYV